MADNYRKQITLKQHTIERLDTHKAIPSESYESLINRILDYIEKEE